MEALALKPSTFLPAAYTFLHYLCTSFEIKSEKLIINKTIHETFGD